MSETEYLRELLETVDVLNPERACERISEALQELRQVEAARTKEAELIQRLVDAVDVLDAYTSSLDKMIKEKAMEAAEAAGFKPSEP
jgi:uncharacterized membrane protein